MSTLILNSDYTPYDIWGWKKTMRKWLSDGEDIVYAIEANGHNPKMIRDGSGNEWPVPIILVLHNYQNPHKRKPTYKKSWVFIRDKMICQYCGDKLSSKETTIDHVIPKSIWKKEGRLGHASRYDNVVTACESCNHKKAARTPRQADMELIHEPREVTRSKNIINRIELDGTAHAAWLPYLKGIIPNYEKKEK
jgi:hypothetical protein